MDKTTTRLTTLLKQPPPHTHTHTHKKNILLKLINNSSSQNQEYHNREESLDYPVLITMDILLLCLFDCFLFSDGETISNTRDSVSSAPHIARISSKPLRCMPCCKFSSRCLVVLMKHCLWSLIYAI